MLVTQHESIAELCAEYGARNIVVQIPTAPLEYVNLIPGIAFRGKDNTEVGIFTICEDRYVVSEGYKIEFAPTTSRFGKERFYISDFDLSWQQGHVRVFIFVQDGDVESYTRVASPQRWGREDLARELGDWGRYRYIQQRMDFCLLPMVSP